MEKSVISGGKTILNNQNGWIYIDLCIDLDINPLLYLHGFKCMYSQSVPDI